MKKLHLALAVLLVLGLAACGGSNSPSSEPNPLPNPKPTPLPGTTNNSAVLSGNELGSGYTPNSQLHKEISVSLTDKNDAFRLGRAYATRDSASSETLYWFIAVVNQSSELQCSIEASTLQFRDSTGQTLVTEDLTFVSGSVGADQFSSIYTDTCLESGQTGYFFGIELEDDTPLLYSSVTDVAVASLSSYNGFSTPTARIIPQSYSPELAVTVRNEGTGAARMGDFSHYFFLDEGNLPLSWGFFDSSFDSSADNPVLDVGDIHTLNEPLFLFYDGLASKVQPQIDFTSPTDTLYTERPTFSAKAVNTEATKKRYVTWRSQLEQAKRQTVESLKYTD